jgi:catechol-2,3-dioxygenase
MKVQGIGAIMIFARQAKELAHWYDDHLGIVTELDESDGNFYGTIEDANEVCSVRFGTYPCEPGVQHSGSVMVNYKVANLAEFKSHLIRKGVEIESEVEAHGSRFLYLRDPEGNRIELWETQATTAIPATQKTSNLREDRTTTVS